MKFIIVKNILSGKKTKILHSLLFHGDYEVNLEMHINRISEKKYQPLKISKGGHVWPNIMMPVGTIIISNKVKESLKEIGNIDFAQIKFSKLIDANYAPGDFSYFDTEAFKKNPYKMRADKILERMPDIKSLHKNQESQYSQLVMPVGGYDAKNKKDLKEVFLEIPHCTSDRCYFSKELSEMCDIYYGGPIVIKRPLFDKISHFLILIFLAILNMIFRLQIRLNKKANSIPIR